METYLPITYLNDFIFCPYSIYLHQIFDEGEDETFSAAPQQKGKTAHLPVDKPQKHSKGMRGSYIISNKLRLYGKIDLYFPKEKRLIEYKREIKTVYRGFCYQIWAQYFALVEMGYEVNHLELVSIVNKERISVDIPGEKEFRELFQHVRNIANFDPYLYQKNSNVNKCFHCIYTSLCDKTNVEHVYS